VRLVFRPHIAPFPISDHSCDVAVIMFGIEAEAVANFTLRAIARELTGGPDPRTLAPVAVRRNDALITLRRP
jgi:hypothetical protein